LGAVPKEILEDNKKKWSGDHLIDPNLVPGVIFSNKKLSLKDPSIFDITPTILTLFDINKASQMKGRSLLKDEEN